jgi:hypothetical protein
VLLQYLTRRATALVENWLTTDQSVYVAIAPLWPHQAVAFELHWQADNEAVDITFRGSRLLSNAIAAATRLLHYSYPELIEPPSGMTDQERLALSSVLNGNDESKQLMAVRRCREG